MSNEAQWETAKRVSIEVAAPAGLVMAVEGAGGELETFPLVGWYEMGQRALVVDNRTGVVIPAGQVEARYPNGRVTFRLGTPGRFDVERDRDGRISDVDEEV